jgi:hypothetical protein
MKFVLRFIRRKTLEAIENEKSYIEGEYIAAGTSERIFGTLQALTDYVAVFKVESGRFGVGSLDGKRIYVLQHRVDRS